MTFEIVFVLLSLLGMMAALIADKMRPGMVLFSVVVLFLCVGILTPKEMLEGFSNKGMITVALLFLVSEGIRQSGTLGQVIKKLLPQGKTTVFKAQLRILPSVAFISAFLNNTPVVVIFAPIIKHWAKSVKLPATKFLIPLSYVTILGGICTLIGTSTNLVVHGMILEAGYEGFTMFELGKVGIFIAIAGIIYLFIFSKRLLPDARPDTAVPDEEVVRIHSSSGTTGKPVIIPYTAKDVDDWSLMIARCYEMAGITDKDRIQITAGYGLWTAGIGFQAGCEKLGAMAIPMGPGNTDKQLQMMVDLKSTVLTATSSYALLLSEEINKRNMRDKIYLKKGIFGSERWSDKMRNYIKTELGVEIYDIYGLTEIYGPGIGISCAEDDGMHYWDDYVYIEIIDPKTEKPVPDGVEGEVVITTLVKEGAPLLRFRTHDISRIIPEPCKCGSHYPRLDTVKGRSDDMFKVHGVNMFPSQVEEILGMVDGVSSEYNINIAHDESVNRDVILVTVEAEGRVSFDKTGDTIRELFKSKLSVTPKITVVPVGTLPRTEKKAKRVIDHRE